MSNGLFLRSFQFLILFFVLQGCAFIPKKNLAPQLKHGFELEPVSAAETLALMETVASDEFEGRGTGTPGIEAAAVFAEKFFKEAGLSPYFETYRDEFEVNGKKASNIVAYLEGSDLELKKQHIIIGAHYDHLGLVQDYEGDNIANGANDNASGVVAVLQIAAHLAKLRQNKRSMIFVLFSAEEMGLRGSRNLSRKLKNQGLDLYVMLNFEMIGVPMDRKDRIAYITGHNRSNMASYLNSYSGEQLVGSTELWRSRPLFKMSDNYPFFMEFSVPCQTISSFDFENYDYYHHVHDEVDEMNIPHMSGLISKLVGPILMISNSAEKEIRLKGSRPEVKKILQN